MDKEKLKIITILLSKIEKEREEIGQNFVKEMIEVGAKLNEIQQRGTET